MVRRSVIGICVSNVPSDDKSELTGRIAGSNPVLTTKPKSILNEHWLTAWKDKQNSQVAELVDAITLNSYCNE